MGQLTETIRTTTIATTVSDDMGVWLGLHVVPVGVLRAAAAEMGQA